MEFEVLAVKLSLHRPVNITVVCTYRPPGVVLQLFCEQLASCQHARPYQSALRHL